MEILEEFPGSNDHTIVKGKRTKRPRPSSSASSNDGGCGGEFYISSPTTSSTVISTSSEEDEDMANCLILLARGSSPPAAAENKFNRRKLAEIATGKVGIYVYECKACHRSFPSFQALGGHKASHKKNKPNTENDRKRSPPAAPPLDDQEPPPSTQVLSKPKIHECSICGSEFASGQALGGHMRRHRPAPNTSTRIGASVDIDTTSHDVDGKPKNMLAFDLNLPAPEDEKFQQPRIGFSAATLVDCHY